MKENRLRKVAQRRGYRLEKSRRRDPRAPDFGGFMLIDAEASSAVIGMAPFVYSATLDDIELYFDELSPMSQMIKESREGIAAIERLISFLNTGAINPLHETTATAISRAEKSIEQFRSLIDGLHDL